MNKTRRELTWIATGNGSPDTTGLPVMDEPFPPRQPGDLSELISSIRLHGVISPLLVRRQGTTLQVICGYRRYLAAKTAGLSEVPAVIVELEDAEAIRCYLEEQVARKPFGLVEQEEVLKLLEALREEGGPSAASVSGAGLLPETETRETSAPAGWSDSPAMRRSMLSVRETSSRLSLSGLDAPEVELRPRGAPAAMGPSALQILKRVESFFSSIRSSRSIEVTEAERIAEDIVALVSSPSPPDLRALCIPGAMEVVPSHSILVAALAARVARFMDWEAVKERDFVLGGLLHDAGMVFLTTPSLREPRALTDEERCEVQSHTRIGCALVASARAWSQDVAYCARDHHERWNGSGYPDGRSGFEISFAGRLLGFLDTYAALVTCRPHRNALEPPFALERLSKALELGLFDPSLYFLLREVLPGSPGTGSRVVLPPTTTAENSVELEEEMAIIPSTQGS
jgi:HD-GYP domain-containing protein (c-di-GMP phosphodiesterase class II)